MSLIIRPLGRQASRQFAPQLNVYVCTDSGHDKPTANDDAVSQQGEGDAASSVNRSVRNSILWTTLIQCLAYGQPPSFEVESLATKSNTASASRFLPAGFFEKPDQIANRVMAVLRMTKRKLIVNLVAVAAALARPRQITRFL